MRITERFIFFCATKEVFSQWHPSPFMVDGVVYSCAEAFMMMQKACLFEDREAMRKLYEANMMALDSFGVYDLAPRYKPDSANRLRDHHRLVNYKEELKDVNLKGLLEASTHTVNFNWKRWEKTPRLMKEIGRNVKNFDQNLWNAHALPSVIQGNMAKFSQNAYLEYILWRTTPKGAGIMRSLELAEAAHYDNVWGIGMREGDANATDPSLWRGDNKLGKAVMMARQQMFPES
jgi:ribA/ribD-fused uncharacterized protein